MSSSAQPTTSFSTSDPATGGNPLALSQNSSPTLPPPVSDEEARYYYGDLPSAPILVARTSTTPWEMPSGPRAAKELRPAGGHPIAEAMQGDLPRKLLAILDSMEVKWSSLDVVRIGIPVILWIGVLPGSLSRSDGVIAAFKCREALVECGITDVDVEICESVVHRWGSVNTGKFASPGA